MIAISDREIPWISVSPRLQTLLGCAPRAANMLTTVEFVSALLNEQNCDVSDALRELGVTEETLRQALGRVYRGKKGRG